MTRITGETLERIEALVDEIRQGGRLFRGESEHYPKVSSTLYRRFESILTTTTKLTPHKLQKSLGHYAKKHFGRELEKFKQDTGEIMRWSGGYDPTKFTEDQVRRVWPMMQHLGGATNLIDFTTDPKIALFFSCSSSLGKNGRVLTFQGSHGYDLIDAQWPQNRIKSQKSRFVWSDSGYVSDEDVKVTDVPQELKVPILKWLVRQIPSISHATMYEDMPGYAKHSSMYEYAVLRVSSNFLLVDDVMDRVREQDVISGRMVREVLMHMDAAVKEMRALVAKEPWFTWAHWQLGNILRGQVGPLQAIVNHRQVDPEMSAQMRIKRERCLDDAIRAYQEALDWIAENDHDPSGETVAILVDLGVAHKMKGNHQDAESALERAMSANPEQTKKLIQDRSGMLEA